MSKLLWIIVNYIYFKCKKNNNLKKILEELFLFNSKGYKFYIIFHLDIVFYIFMSLSNFVSSQMKLSALRSYKDRIRYYLNFKNFRYFLVKNIFYYFFIVKLYWNMKNNLKKYRVDIDWKTFSNFRKKDN